MKVMYHSDIIPEVTSAFIVDHECPESLGNMFESLAAFRLRSTAPNVPGDITQTLSPIQQVGATIQGYLEANPDAYTNLTSIELSPYRPECLGSSDIRNAIIDSCSKGIFIPLIIGFEAADLARAQAGKSAAYILAGFGETPGRNFLMVTINLGNLVSELHLSMLPDDHKAQIIYPVVFDVPRKIMGSTISKASLTMRSFILDTTNTAAVVPEWSMEDIEHDSTTESGE